MGPEPAAAGMEEQGFGWKNKCGKGNAEDTVTSGLEGAWTVNPVAWTTQYLDNLFAFDWVQTKSPAGAIQWIPANDQAANAVPDAHDKTKRHAPFMLTTDLSLKFDPSSVSYTHLFWIVRYIESRNRIEEDQAFRVENMAQY